MVKDDGILNFINATNGGILQKYFYDPSKGNFYYDTEYSMNSMQEMMAFREVIESVENNPSIKKYFDLYKKQLVETQDRAKEGSLSEKLKERELEQETQKRLYLYIGLFLVVVFAIFYV